MKNLTRLTIAVLAVLMALTWSACSSDGYSGTSTVYVGMGYGGYGPGWGYGWGGYHSPPPVVIGPPRPMPY
jgi:hypothetical protein